MKSLRIVLVLAWAVMLPAIGFAQATITGLVKDSSGAVLPGVTVEAASSALIEKTRAVVSDGTGRYRIVDLRPGTYSVTFTLAGFNTVKRDGLELSGSFSATVDAEMRVGALEETITVSGETPTVDIQNTARERVFTKEVIDSLPTTRSHVAMAVLLPGVQVAQSGANAARAQDVGGSMASFTFQMIVHGSKAEAQRLLQNGVSMAGPNGSTRQASPSPTSVQEFVMDIGGTTAEADTGGIQINFISKSGGNAFKGTLFGTFTNESLEGDNLTQDIQNRGLTTSNRMKEVWDFNPGVGGPIKKDKLWFFFTARRNRVSNWSGVFRNVNEGNPNAWTYVPDPSKPFANTSNQSNGTVRLTWQASPKNKIGGMYDVQNVCSCPDRAGTSGIGTSRAPEASFDRDFNNQHQVEFDWTSPITSRFLFEASALHRTEGYAYRAQVDGVAVNPAMIAVTEQSTGMTYRAFAPYQHNWSSVIQYRAAVSYITGSHSFKVGFNDANSPLGPVTTSNLASQTAYRFNNGVPNQLTEYATPYTVNGNVDHDMGLFVQDRWTVKHLTLTGGVRYSYFADSYPEQTLGPTLLAPTRNATFAAASNVSWHDIVPRMGMAWDVFGNGKTAVKMTLNKYLSGNGSTTISQNPVNTVVQNTTRNWTDANKDFIPNCDLVNPAANGECGAMANVNFGKSVIATTYDPNTVTGWGKRNYNWEFSAGVQQEILPRVSAEVNYFRRSYGNYLVTDNTLAAASDYTSFSLTAPVDSRLPGGGGNTISGFVNLNPNKVGLVNNYVTFSDNYGGEIDRWNGVDVSINARLSGGATVQGGVSTGRTTEDNCALMAQLPEIQFNTLNFVNTDPGVTPSQFCHIDENWQTQLKLAAVYTVPRVDVQVSGTVQSVPGIQIQANWVVPNAQVQPALGRALSAGATTLATNLVQPGTLYGERVNQLDLRLSKILKFGRTRTSLNFDIYNATNSSTVLQENYAYASWRTPATILVPRILKFSATMDF